MAGNFIVFRSFVYIPGALIRSSENNTNENTIYTGHNGAFNEVTGHEHTGAPGDAPILGPASINLAANYTWTGIHNFNNTANLNFGGVINNYTITASTLIVPTIADFTLAQHTHQNAAGGGTLDTAAIVTGILPVVRGGTGVNTSTGSGSVVLNNSPTLITPAIADFTNAIHNHQNNAGGGTLDASVIATGILLVVRGGTGTNTATGTAGSVVLSNSPTIATPTLTVPVIADFTSAQHNHQNAAGGGTLDASAIATGILVIARGGTGSGVVPAAGQVIYSNGSAYVGSASHFWDAGSDFLGIGTSSPGSDLHISKAGTNVEIRVERTGSAGTSTVSLIDGSGTNTVIQSNGSTNAWSIVRGGTYLAMDNANDVLEYATHSGTPTFGRVQMYTGYLSTTAGSGGTILSFRIANSRILGCKLLLNVSSGGIAAGRSDTYEICFTAYRDGAGTKGMGQPTAGAGGASTIVSIGNSSVLLDAPGAAAYPATFPFNLGNSGALPQVLQTTQSGLGNLTLVDGGTDIISIQIGAWTAPAGTASFVARLETIENEYL